MNPGVFVPQRVHPALGGEPVVRHPDTPEERAACPLCARSAARERGST